MKLYFSPGACSLSPHIVLREADIPFTLDKIDSKAKKTSTGDDFNAINPKSYVPTLTLDNGQVLTEGAVIVQYLADQKPASGLIPAAGTMERYRAQEWLNFIATEIHKGFSPLFGSSPTDEAKKPNRDRLNLRLALVAKQLADKQFLLGDKFSVADAYLFTVLRWTKPTQVSLEAWPAITSFMDRVAARPAVHAALVAEGLAS